MGTRGCLFSRLISVQKISHSHVPPPSSPPRSEGLPLPQEVEEEPSSSAKLYSQFLHPLFQLHVALMVPQNTQVFIYDVPFPWEHPSFSACSTSPDPLGIFVYLYCYCSFCEWQHHISEDQPMFPSPEFLPFSFPFLADQGLWKETRQNTKQNKHKQNKNKSLQASRFCVPLLKP